MKKWLLSLIFAFPFFIILQADVSSDRANESVKELDSYIEKRDHYIQQKEDRINKLRSLLPSASTDQEKFDLYDSLFEEYKSYKYDSAYAYSQKGLDIAIELSDQSKIIEAKLHAAFCYLSSGLFKEAFDVMDSINIKDASPQLKKDYYILFSRLCYDTSDYTKGDSARNEYVRLGTQYSDSALVYLTVDSLEFWSTIGLKRMQQKDFLSAIDAFQKMLYSDKNDDHSKAIATSSIAFLYSNLDKREEAIHYMAQAAINDIKSATKETVAMQNLARLLFESGELTKANRYVRLAMEDADFYNARHRKIEISSILPIIEKQHFNNVEKQKNNLIIFAVAVSFMFVLLLISTIIIYKQMRKLRLAKRTIQKQNKQLLEANKIKDEYVIQSLYSKSEYIDQLEKIYKTIDRKIKARQYDDLLSICKSSDLRKERENMYSSFDQTFLKLFPNFIEEYNKFFSAEDAVHIDTSKGLTPELRIFALIRLGIYESNRIANFLDYSVNTINTYKTKIKNKSIIPNELFEQEIMEIKTVHE